MKIKVLFGHNNEVDNYVTILFGFAVTINEFYIGLIIYKEI
jgi:hypothetical protein